MIEEIKVMLGAAASNFTEAQIGLALKQAMAEVQGYCNRELDYELEIIAERIAVIKLNRTNSEGLAAPIAVLVKAILMVIPLIFWLS